MSTGSVALFCHPFLGLVPRCLERARVLHQILPWRRAETIACQRGGAIEHCLDAGGWVVTLETSHNPPGDVRTAIEHHLQTVSPTGPMCSTSQAPSRPQAESSRRQWRETAAVAEGGTESGSTWRSWQRHLQIPLSCCGAMRQQDPNILVVLTTNLISLPPRCRESHLWASREL